jgi:hypothetical protein
MNTVRKMTTFGGTALLLLALCVAFVLPVLAEGQAGTTLTATVDVTPHWTVTYGWTIDKSVTPATWDLFKGDSGTSKYTITVTKDSGTQEAWVDGQICVTNGGAVATENLAITAVLQDGYGPPNDFLTSAPVDVSGNPVLDPGETGCYDYHVNIPITGGAYPQPHAGGTYKVTADVTITNHSGHLGEPFGPSPSDTAVFISAPTLVNDTINVDDTNGGSWEFSASGSESYEKTFSCDADEGKHKNIATIRETGLSDDATVTVNCYALKVTKDASASFKRTYNWTIDKWADQSALTLATGEQFLVNYSVKVDATYVDSDWAVNGTIKVKNPAPIAATINGVADVVSPDIAATVDCGVEFPYTLAASGTLECSYSAKLPDASSRTNTATATLQNYDYDYEMNATADGTTDFSGTADVDFGNATINHVDECIDVSDTFAGALGTVCYSDLPKTFTYSRWIGPYSVCGDYTVENTASFVTNDTGTTGSDSWTVNINVPCAGGCSLTPGYWKTHSSYGPAPYDDNWALLPDGADTTFFLSSQSWYGVLWTNPSGGNAYYILAHAYIAAKLNILNGAASTPAVDSALAWADTFFGTYAPSAKLSKTVRADAISYASLLDQYNNGYIGPGHCSE